MIPPSKKKVTPRDRMIEDLKRSGLNAADAKKLRLEPFTAASSTRLHLSRAGEGFKIPYFDADGKLLKMFRYRYFDTVIESGFTAGAELRKYDQPLGTPMEVYFPPLDNWKAIEADVERSLIVTEGEKKAACGTKNGLPTIGLGGADCWGGRKKGKRLHSALEAFNLRGRNVFICYDSDAVKNPQVMRAENRLAAVLVDVMSARVFIVRIPMQESGAKMGMDDYIVKYGAAAFQKLLDSAEEWALSRELSELSANFAFVRSTATVVEISTARQYAPDTFARVLEGHRKASVTDARGNPRFVPAAPLWLESSGKTTVDSMTYEPGAPPITTENKLNLWRPSGIDPHSGDTEPFDQLVEHLICDAADRDWFWKWAAYPHQHPGARLNVAVVEWSPEQGQGKSLKGETLGLLYGAHNYTEIGQAELDSPFNPWQGCKQFIMGSELLGDSPRGAKASADRLKSVITASEILINQKHQQLYKVQNAAAYYLTSNHSVPVFLDNFARRFMVIRANGAKLPQGFYSRFIKWRNSGGLLYKMLCVDLAGFEPGADAPRTEAMREMVAAGRTDLQAWCHALKEDSESTLLNSGAASVLATSQFATAKQLLAAYLGHSNGNQRVNQQQLANELAAAGFMRANRGIQIRISQSGEKQRLWVLRGGLRAANMTPDQIGEAWGKRFGSLRQRAKEG